MIEDILAETAEKMGKAVSHSREEFSTIRTGRASPAFVEKLVVDYYGSEVPLQQIAGFSIPEARTSSSSPTTRVRSAPSRRRSATRTSGSTRAATATCSG